MLLNFYRVVGLAICLTFCFGAAKGWKSPSLGLTGGSGASGFFSSGGGRYSSGASGWGGGK